MWPFKQVRKSRFARSSEARKTLNRQIAILEAGPMRPEIGDAEYMQAQAAELRQTLLEIEDELRRARVRGIPVPYSYAVTVTA